MNRGQEPEKDEEEEDDDAIFKMFAQFRIQVIVSHLPIPSHNLEIPFVWFLC